MSKYPAICSEFFDTPWDIRPEKMADIEGVLLRRLDDDRDIPAEFSEAGRRKDGESRRGYRVQDGVGIIPIYGVIQKRMNMFMEFSGGTSTDMLKQTVQDALADRSVKALVLDIDSPGGSVFGPAEVAETIFQARKNSDKQIVAVANEMMASAAYKIGSAAHEVVVTPTAIAGSIGTIITHREFSKQDEARGITTTVIRSGKFKALGGPDEPLGKVGREALQALVDHYGSLFVQAVANHRGVSAEQVWKDMGQGREFIGQQAVDAGLADRVGTLDEVVSQLAAGTFTNRKPTSRGVAAMSEQITAEAKALADSIDAAAKEAAKGHVAATELSALQKELADLKAQVEAAKTEAAASAKAAAEQATAAEHERVTTINALCATAGMPDMAAKLIADKSTPQQAQQILFAKLAAKNVALGDGGGRQEEKPADPDDKYRKEFRAHAGIYADMGIDEAGYISSRRIDDGLDVLKLTPAGK